MAKNNYFGVKKGIRFKPSTLPVSGNAGEIAYDEATSSFKTWNGSSWVNLSGGTSSANTKNYIINSNFKIFQRGYTAQTGLADVIRYHADRFAWAAGSIGGVVKSENLDSSAYGNSSILPRNCNKMLRYEVTTDQSVLNANATAGPWYKVEGYDWEQILSEGALTDGVTLSFYVASSTTGTYTIEFGNSVFDNRYFTTYTINSANTWQRVSIFLTASEIATGIGSGTWNYTNDIGLTMRFWLAAGTTSNGATQNAWTGATPNVPASQVNLYSTLGNTWGMTGVMFHVGNEAIDFKTRGINLDEELTLSRRYYEKTYELTTAPGTAATNNQLIGYGSPKFNAAWRVDRASSAAYWDVYQASTDTKLTGGTLQIDGTGKLNNGAVQASLDPRGGLNAPMDFTQDFMIWVQMRWKVTKRTSPSVTIYNPNTGATGSMYHSSGSINASTDSGGQDSCHITNSTAGRPGAPYTMHVIGDAEL